LHNPFREKWPAAVAVALVVLVLVVLPLLAFINVSQDAQINCQRASLARLELVLSQRAQESDIVNAAQLTEMQALLTIDPADFGAVNVTRLQYEKVLAQTAVYQDNHPVPPSLTCS
jgi:hypothetical protein